MPRLPSACLAALAAASCLLDARAAEPDAFVLEAGSGHQARVAGVGFRVPLALERLRGRPRICAGVLVRLDRWESRAAVGHQSLHDVSVTPYVSYAMGHHWGANLFLEAGLGMHLLSQSSLGKRHFGSAFQFGEFAGAAARFGAGDAYQVGLRVEHVSNGGLQPPNDGMTYTSVSFAWRF